MSGLAPGPRRIVVGMDSSAEAGAALAWARHVAAPDASITVVRAWEIPALSMSYVPEMIFPSDFEQYAREALDETLADVDDGRISTVLHQGHPGRAIVEEADDADLIVVGHRGDSRVTLVLGSTANYVLHHAACPVVVVRGHGGPEIRRVVVGVDAHGLDDADACEDANESVRALQWAYTLPGVEHIRVLHGWFIPPIVVGMFATPVVDVEAMDAAAARSIRLVIDAAGPSPDGVTVVPEVERASGGRALIDASSGVDDFVGFGDVATATIDDSFVFDPHVPLAIQLAGRVDDVASV